ncbi:MAG: FecR domain-containing protein [Chitinophagaceae bacterium]|nr:FecR domain-containing protein [Chitinophagaceae bacterium]
MIDRELIERYLRNDCTVDEKRAIAQYFDEYPDELDVYFPEHELYGVTGRLPPDVSERILDKVRRRSTAKTYDFYHFGRLTIAASVILFFGIAIYEFQHTGSTANKQSILLTAADPAQIIRVSNDTQTERLVLLPDGSRITLKPDASVEWKNNFINQKERRLDLSGEAYFEVIHDEQKPFIVQTDNLLTMDLGTTFTIKNNPGERDIRVQLFSGKLQVKNTVGLASALPNDGLLFPGEELVYSKVDRKAFVSIMGIKRQLVRASGGKRNVADAPRPDWFMFNNQPLPSVLNQLSVYYRTDIYYYPVDFKDRYFSGKFEAGDSLEKILKDISLLNGLTLVSRQGGYFLVKKQ